MEELELLEEKVVVTLSYQGVVDDTFSRKLLFSVTTKENQAEFIKFRNSIDFTYLRSQMMKKWVSFLVPSFPKLSFSLLRSVNNESINRKTKYLQEFLQECVSNPELFSSSDIQLFLKGPESYIENSKTIQLDFREIYTKMSYKTKDLPEISFDSSTIRSQSEHISTCLSELKTMKKKIKLLSSTFSLIQENQSIFFTEYSRIDTLYLSHLSNEEDPDRSLSKFGDTKNPFLPMIHWVTKECFIFKSVIEELEKFFELERILDKTEKKLNRKKDEIKELQLGKRPLSTMFTLKNSEDIKSKTSSDIDEIESQVTSMNLLLRLLYLHITTKTLPGMASDKLKRYQDAIEKLSLDTISSFSGDIE